MRRGDQVTKVGPKEAQLAELREVGSNRLITRFKLPPKPRVEGGKKAQKKAASEPKGVKGVQEGLDPAFVAQAVKFYQKHLDASRAGMRAFRKRAKAKNKG
jgi:hypothetical protein